MNEQEDEVEEKPQRAVGNKFRGGGELSDLP